MTDHFPLSPLGQRIFSDRYALRKKHRDVTRDDTAVVLIDKITGQRELGTAKMFKMSWYDGCGKEYPGIDKVLMDIDGEEKWYPIDQLEFIAETPEQTVTRVANAVAQAENEPERKFWATQFKDIMTDWKFIPAGRILTAAGNPASLTYYNCYVIPSPQDSRGGIMKTLETMTEIMSRGGGVGINISSLRPRKALVKGVNGHSSGAVSWGGLYSYTTGLIEQGGSRRGALMLILNDWHPDLLEFIEAKKDNTKLVNANISIALSDEFMEAVEKDLSWNFQFPNTEHPDYDKDWDGDLDKWWLQHGLQSDIHAVNTYNTVKARDVWNKIIESAWASAEPGIWFTDRSNDMSNSWYYDQLISTNPCGEQPLPAWGVCNLGSINLSKFVKDGEVDWSDLHYTIVTAVRFLDDVIDETPYHFKENEDQQRKERRIGLNTMGLADMMIQLGIRYGSEESIDFICELYAYIRNTAYIASIELAVLRGSFPNFQAKKYMESGYVKNLPKHIQNMIEQYGIRNVTLLTQAPNGTIGTMVG